MVAQLVRVPACHAGGCGFDSRPPRSKHRPSRKRGLLFFGAGAGRLRATQELNRFSRTSGRLGPPLDRTANAWDGRLRSRSPRERRVHCHPEIAARDRNRRLWTTVVELTSISQAMVRIEQEDVWSALCVERPRTLLRLIEEIRKAVANITGLRDHPLRGIIGIGDRIVRIDSSDGEPPR